VLRQIRRLYTKGLICGEERGKKGKKSLFRIHIFLTLFSRTGTEEINAVEALLLKRSIASTPENAKERIEKVCYSKFYPLFYIQKNRYQ
jgi:hypothetical protein